MPEQTVNIKGSQAVTVASENAEIRGRIIKHLEDALALSEEINDALTGYLVECALDQARASIFRPEKG